MCTQSRAVVDAARTKTAALRDFGASYGYLIGYSSVVDGASVRSKQGKASTEGTPVNTRSAGDASALEKLFAETAARAKPPRQSLCDGPKTGQWSAPKDCFPTEEVPMVRAKEWADYQRSRRFAEKCKNCFCGAGN